MATRHGGMMSIRLQALLFVLLGLQSGQLTVCAREVDIFAKVTTLAFVVGSARGSHVKWLGTQSFPFEMEIQNSEPDGLITETISSISWSHLRHTSVNGANYITTDSDLVYATSDNSKLYKLRIDLADGWLDDGDIGKG